MHISEVSREELLVSGKSTAPPATAENFSGPATTIRVTNMTGDFVGRIKAKLGRYGTRDVLDAPHAGPWWHVVGNDGKDMMMMF